MLLESLTLHDVGVYRGRQTMDLRPPSPDRPVTLVGGLNGGGKTTLLDAIQLAFHGRLSGPAQRGSYDEYLRRLVNRSANPSDGASVELAFRIHIEGKERQYRVRRSWRAR